MVYEKNEVVTPASKIVTYQPLIVATEIRRRAKRFWKFQKVASRRVGCRFKNKFKQLKGMVIKDEIEN